MTWRNWGRTFSADPISVEQPADVDELRSLLRSHRGTRLGIKAVGAGHSFSAIAQPEATQLRLDAFSGLIRVDFDRGRARFGAGTHMHQIAPLLEPFGLALPNMGDIDRQTLAGAISTGTHGTGLGLPSIGAGVTAVQLVTGRGEVLEVSSDSHPALLPAVRLGLGALGVLTEIELQCVPAFTLSAHETTEPLDAVVDQWDARIRGAEHFEFYWFPHTSVATTKTNRRTSDPADAAHGIRDFSNDWLVQGAGFGAVARLASLVPTTTPAINRLTSRLMAGRDRTDRSDRVFVSRRVVRFRETEFAVPVDAAPEVFRELQSIMQRPENATPFPVEVRAAAADDAMLSTAYERDVAYFAIHVPAAQDPRRLFADVQRMFQRHEGRPHWGKMHSFTHRHFRHLLPRFDDFVQVRNELDPDRIFANAYPRQVLGA